MGGTGMASPSTKDWRARQLRCSLATAASHSMRNGLGDNTGCSSRDGSAPAGCFAPEFALEIAPEERGNAVVYARDGFTCCGVGCDRLDRVWTICT